jgi:hypothetical protein
LEPPNRTCDKCILGMKDNVELMRKRRLMHRRTEWNAIFILACPIPPVTLICPMDLRRAYARFLHQSGLNLVDIAANLGLKNINGVRDYIGPSVRVTRIPPSPPENG